MPPETLDRHPAGTPAPRLPLSHGAVGTATRGRAAWLRKGVENVTSHRRPPEAAGPRTGGGSGAG
ncbi:putative metalloprotease [Methylorubrum populi]|uniref:Putative metalloprotease n=1 Tax=Methylorubrum populi TaxID=223967 RepID=A0A160PI14_9HYPH|nr:putative metalloprotease [Methylorubrum populi]